VKIAFAMIICNRRDGSARAVNEVAEKLADRGHEVHLFARKAEDLDLKKIRWHKVPGIEWPEVANFWTYHVQVNRTIPRGYFDIIHSIGCNTLRANVITIQNIQPAKKKILDRLGEKVSLPRQLTRALYLKVTSDAEYKLYTHRAARRPPLFLPVSRGVERELRDHYDIGPAPVKIVPNAADLNVFKPISESQRLAWRSDNGLSAEDIVLIFVGGEWARKGLDLGIRALALIANPRAKLFIAGDDPAKSTFKKLAFDCRVADRVIFGGFRKDVPIALASSDIFLFPSWYEAFSLATIEAAACGLPVVATSINGTEDFIQPGINGDFVKSDPKHIAEVLEPLIANPERRREMGSNARHLVEQNYTWERVTIATEKAYQEYLANQPMRNAGTSPRIFWFATKGAGSNDALRIDRLLSKFEGRKEIPFSKKGKVAGLVKIIKTVSAEKPNLLVMEGTGICGGAACLYGKLFHGVPYVFSSGDAVGPFVRSHHQMAGLPFELYERVLCRLSAGFIGWTPYLCGRAMTFGAPRAMTAAGWPLGSNRSAFNLLETKQETRAKLGISQSAIVVGIVGALEWNARRQYSYGWDLVECARRIRRRDVTFLIVGGGTAIERLRKRAGDLLGKQVIITGPVPLEEVLPILCAFDVASLPQSMDGVGMFRYTTKIAEYLAARLPVITNQVPMAYDLGADWMWRLPGSAPWDETYLKALAKFVEDLQVADIAEAQARIPEALPEFREEDQIRRVTAFVTELLSSQK
jgi:glycosyltransferase involved in cell wall biosynthesis